MKFPRSKFYDSPRDLKTQKRIWNYFQKKPIFQLKIFNFGVCSQSYGRYIIVFTKHHYNFIKKLLYKSYSIVMQFGHQHFLLNTKKHNSQKEPKKIEQIDKFNSRGSVETF